MSADLLQTILTNGAIVLGLFSVYVAIFTFEDEHDKVQNRLLDLQGKIVAGGNRPSIIKLFMTKIVDGLRVFFGRFFYDGKISVGFFVVCLLLSASLALVIQAIIYWDKFGEFPSPLAEPEAIASMILGIISLVLFLVVFGYKKPKILFPIVHSLSICGGFFYLYVTIAQHGLFSSWDYFIPGFIAGLVLAAINLMIVVLILILSVKVISRFIQSGWHWLLIILISMFAFFVVILIISASMSLPLLFPIEFEDVEIEFFEVYQYSVSGALLLNAFIFYGFILLGVLSVLNKLFWAILKLPIRALYEHKLIKNRRLFGAVGVALLSYGIPGFRSLPIIGPLLDFLKFK